MRDSLKDRLLEKTDNGLDILKDLYTDLTDQNGQVKKKFKIRNEKTPSAQVFQNKDGAWCVIDYGDDQQPRNAIDAWMESRGMDSRNGQLFGVALQMLAQEYGVAEVLSADVNKSRIVERDATPEEAEGEMLWEERDFTEQELRLLGPLVSADTCHRLHYHCLEWYGRVKDRRVKEWHSDPDLYPIFMRECLLENAPAGQPDRFYKIYKPKEPEKRWRFIYAPKDMQPGSYVHGLVEMKELHHRLNSDKAAQDENWKTAKLSDIPREHFDRGVTRYHLVVLCSGERDALCVAARGDIPLWMNSETKVIPVETWREIVRYAGDVYSIPDMDATGIRQGTLKALQYPELKTVWLPSWLSARTDNRQRHCKDFRDWCGYHPLLSDYHDLMDKAAPARFWQYSVSERSGKANYQIDTSALHNFLRLHGFFRLKDDAQDEPQFVRLVDSTIIRKRPRDIRDFVRLWTLDEADPDRPGERIRQSSNVVVLNQVRNLVLNDVKLSPAYLSALPEVSPSLQNAGPQWQRVFFRNGVATVTADGVEFQRWKDYQGDTYCWRQNVIQRDYHEAQPMFRVSRLTDADGRPRLWEDGTPAFDVEVLDSLSSHYFGYLINSSRLYWRKEMETPWADEEQRAAYRSLHPFDISGAHLTAEEQQTQRRCLASKIFALGYMLHTWKSYSRPWAVYCMDNRISEDSKANGRSGKSFFFRAFEDVMQMSVTKLSGRNDHLTDSDFIYERVDRSTQIVRIDDLSKRIQVDSFFDVLSDDLMVNAKNVKSFTIPFSESPKFGFSTNYVPANFDGSGSARLLYLVFGDYYHEKAPDDDQDYLSSRSIRDDFDKNLFGTGYTDQEWNADQNFLLQCQQFYLSVCDQPVKLQPDMGNIKRRHLLAKMGDSFREWAEAYFSYDGGNVNRLVPCEEAYNDFIRTTKSNTWKQNTFTRTLRAFAEYAPWIREMNPKEVQNTQGRVFDYKVTVKNAAGRDVNPECYYLQTVDGWQPGGASVQQPTQSDLKEAELWSREHGDEAF